MTEQRDELNCMISGVADYPNYLVTSSGGVFNLSGHRIACPNDKKGYPRVYLRRNGVAKQHRIHRLVARAFIPNPENKAQVNHKDGDKTNNHISNLEWCTQSENMRHSYKSLGHRVMVGEKNGKAKLSDKDVKDMKSKHSQGLTYRELASTYGVSYNHVYEIIRGNRRTAETETREIMERRG